MLLELAQTIGLRLKRTASTRGGEYHSACPACGMGDDRFMIWPKVDRYYCRRCEIWGDSIQFCRDFMNMSFREACLEVGKETTGSFLERSFERQKLRMTFYPSKSWEEKASEFIKSCHQRLLVDEKALTSFIQERGLSLDTIRQYSIGWNPIKRFLKREEWGLEKETKEDGTEKKLGLPAGIVIPIFREQALRKIKIRRCDEEEIKRFGKYYILPGSIDCIPIFGNPSQEVVVVVEAELDGILVVQEAHDLCCCIALGGAQKRPDAALHQWLQGRETIIFALDFDEGGKEEYAYWHFAYPNLHLWPVPLGKSPTNAWKQGVNLRQWVLSGIQRSEKNNP